MIQLYTSEQNITHLLISNYHKSNLIKSNENNNNNNSLYY